MFLGSWIVTAIHTIGIATFLIVHQKYLAAVVLCVLNSIAHSRLLGLMEFPLMPIRVPLRKAWGLPPTHQEGVFAAICDRRAKKYGIKLAWNKYAEAIVHKEVGKRGV